MERGKGNDIKRKEKRERERSEGKHTKNRKGYGVDKELRGEKAHLRRGKRREKALC